MKKYLPIIFIIVILAICFFRGNNEVKSVFFNDENTIYKVYDIELDNITFDKYKSLFVDLNQQDYKILNFEFVNNYNKELSIDINKIKIDGGDYLTSIEEYINKYLDILKEYDIEGEISKVQNANMLISGIKIYTTEEIYEKIKKDASASKFTI